MTPDELPADMEAPARALAMRLERRALEYNDRQGCYAYIGDDCALDDRAAQALRALLKAYQEQRRALERLANKDNEFGSEVQTIADTALNQKGDER